MSIITTILCTPNSNVEYNFFTSPIFSGLLSGMIGAGIAFLTAHLIANRTDKKEIRNKLIALNANLSAFEYIILALAHDYILAGYAYAYSFTKERLTGINASSTMKADRVESARDKFELNMFFCTRKLRNENMFQGVCTSLRFSNLYE